MTYLLAYRDEGLQIFNSICVKFSQVVGFNFVFCEALIILCLVISYFVFNKEIVSILETISLYFTKETDNIQ